MLNKLKLPNLNLQAMAAALQINKAKQEPSATLSPDKALLREVVFNLFGESQAFKQYLPMVEVIYTSITNEEASKCLDAIVTAGKQISFKRSERADTQTVITYDAESKRKRRQ